MCLNSYTHFAKCDHINTALVTCPTYHKQQASAKGFFGSLFRRNIRTRKNCGRVIPSELRFDAYCDSCSVKKQHLRGDEVGQGALEVRKQDFQEIFQEERKEAARNALHKVEKERHHLRSKKTSNHDVIHVKSSVWLNDLYYHPETLARKEAYAREAVRAPPVSQHQPMWDRKPADTRPKTSTATIQERHGGKQREVKTKGEWMPAYGTEKPLRRPLPPATAHSRLRPDPRNDDKSFAARAQAKGYPDPRSHWPERYSTPHTHYKNNASSASFSSLSCSKPSTSSSRRTKNRYDAAIATAQEHDAQLQARYHNMRYVEDELMMRSAGSANRNIWVPEPSRPRKAALAEIVEKARERRAPRESNVNDGDSDVSFVCQTSRAISNDKNTKKKKTPGERQRRHHR